MAAAPERIFELVRNIVRWPQLLPHYRRVKVRSRRGPLVIADMIAVRRFGPVPVPVAWRAEQWSDGSDVGDLRLHFRHVAGVTRGMAVTWHIEPRSRGARVTIEHDFSRRLPLLGDEVLPWIVDRLFVRPIASRTLAAFRSLAEQVG